MQTSSETIAPATFKSPVNGVNLIPGSLGDQLTDGPTLIIFLRFFGCIFCRETVSDLRQLSENQPGFPTVLFVSQAGATEARAFVRRYWPEARVVSDPEARLYAAFGVGRSVLKPFAPGVFKARSRATGKGIEGGSLDGDIFRLPGAFLVRGAEIHWRHEFRHSADHPDFAQVGRRAASDSWDESDSSNSSDSPTTQS